MHIGTIKMSIETNNLQKQETHTRTIYLFFFEWIKVVSLTPCENLYKKKLYFNWHNSFIGLSGEAALIATIVEQFSAHWIKSNSEPIVHADAAYVISYAVIILNTDQHNKNHNNTPMTAEQFKRNLRGTNGGKDHDQVK